MACIKIREVLNALFKEASFCVTSLALAAEQLSKWMQAEKQTNWTVSVRGLRMETDKWGDVGKWIRWGGVYQGQPDEKPCSEHIGHAYTHIHFHKDRGTPTLSESNSWSELELRILFFKFQHQKSTLSIPQEEITFITVLTTEMSPVYDVTQNLLWRLIFFFFLYIE